MFELKNTIFWTYISYWPYQSLQYQSGWYVKKNGLWGRGGGLTLGQFERKEDSQNRWKIAKLSDLNIEEENLVNIDQPEAEHSLLCKSRLSLATRFIRLSFSSTSSLSLAISCSFLTISQDAVLSLAVNSSILSRCKQQISPNSADVTGQAGSFPLKTPAEEDSDVNFWN